MGKIKDAPVHILIDLENIELSIHNSKEPESALLHVDIKKLVNDLIKNKQIGEHQVHVFMPLGEELWVIPKRDKLQHFGYNVITAKKTFNGRYSKADMDASIGTVLGIVCSQTKTQEVWLFTGDGDFIPAIRVIRNQYKDVKIKLGCVTKSTKASLFKEVEDVYVITHENEGVVKKN